MLLPEGGIATIYLCDLVRKQWDSYQLNESNIVSGVSVVDVDGNIIYTSPPSQKLKRWDSYDSSEIPIVSLAGSECNSIYGIAVAKSGNVYMLTACQPPAVSTYKVLKLTAGTGLVTTFADASNIGLDIIQSSVTSRAMAVDNDEAVYVPDGKSSIWRVAPGNGTFSVYLTGLNAPTDIAVRREEGRL